MDHEFFTHSLEKNQSGWDWFSLQLDDGSELMLYRIRRKDGSVEPYSSGTFVDAKGRPRHLRLEEFETASGPHLDESAVKGRVPGGMASPCPIAVAGRESHDAAGQPGVGRQKQVSGCLLGRRD